MKATPEMAKTANGVWVANTWEKEEHKCLSWELCAPGLRGSGKWSLRQRFIARARTLGEEQGKLTWCLSCLDQGFPRLNLAREQQGGSFLARANGERVSTVHEHKVFMPLTSQSIHFLQVPS